MTSLGLLGAAGVSARGEVTAEVAPKLASVAPKGLMKCRPYLQAPSATGMTVRWITHVPSYSWVEYGESPTQLNRKVMELEEGLAQTDNTIHAITLSGLEPGKTYYYRAVSREVKDLTRRKVKFGATEASAVHPFQTWRPLSDRTEFLMLNDIHDRPESFAHLFQFHDGSRQDFVFLNGDMFNFEESEDQIVNHLLHPITEQFASHTPFFFGRGNHETWGNYSRQLRDYFDGAREKFHYSFTCGPMHAIVMDTGESKADDDAVHGGIHAFDAYRAMQAEWLAREVETPAFRQAKFRVAFIHIPPYHMNEEIHASYHSRDLWVPMLNAAKIDLMLCGHTHRHGIHPAERGKHEFPIVIGGGPKDGKRTITHVRVDERQLTLTMKDDGGRVVGELNLSAT